MDEAKREKMDRAITIFEESVLKPDNRLRSCAHNQECFYELMEVRADVLEYLKDLRKQKLWQ